MIRQSILCATCACLLFAFGPPGRLAPPNRPGTLQHTKGSTMQVKAYLQITMQISEANRPAAVKVYTDYRQPFLDTIEAALTNDLLVCDEDVQVLHGFDSVERAKGLPGKRPVQSSKTTSQPAWPLRGTPTPASSCTRSHSAAPLWRRKRQPASLTRPCKSPASRGSFGAANAHGRERSPHFGILDFERKRLGRRTFEAVSDAHCRTRDVAGRHVRRA